MSLAAIHILKKELGLSDADYRAILRDVAGVASAAKLDQEGDRAVMTISFGVFRLLYRTQTPDGGQTQSESPASIFTGHLTRLAKFTVS